MANQRMKRVEHSVKAELATIIQQEIKDPRFGFTTVSSVSVSKDLRSAVVFVSFLSDDEDANKQSLSILENASGFIRYELGKKVVLKYLPALKFVHDTSTQYAAHIDGVLRGIKASQEAEGAYKDVSEVNDKIQIVQGDITEMDVDAIVNAANNDLVLGSGVAGAIRTKGGPTIQEECNKIGRIPIGEAAMTGGGNLKARYVIHAASMGSGKLTDADSLADSVKNSLLRAEENNLRSVAFPAIGTGVAGFPIDKCADIMLGTVTAHLEVDSSIETVYLVLYDNAAFEAFSRKSKA